MKQDRDYIRDAEGIALQLEGLQNALQLTLENLQGEAFLSEGKGSDAIKLRAECLIDRMPLYLSTFDLLYQHNEKVIGELRNVTSNLRQTDKGKRKENK